FDRPRPSVRTSAGDVRAITLSAELHTALREQAQSESVSLFILLLTAYKVLLHRLSGATDLLVGTPVANRDRSETQGLIGLFLNTVVLRSDLTGDPSFGEVLKRVREVALEAYDRPELPFDRVVEKLKPERSLSLTPLFQTMFVLEAQPSSLAETQQALNFELSPLSIHNGTSQFDLSLLLHPDHGGLRCSVEFSTDVFDGETIERLLENWRTLLEGVVQDPRRRISELPIVDEVQRRRIFSEWNRTATEMPAGATLQALFEERVARSPEARAVELGGSRRTYAELNQEANRLAHYLKQQGAGPEVRIGLLLDRSIEWVTSLLAIFKAGAAYVPLDPLYPKSRLVYMAGDAGVSRILSHSSLAGLVQDSQIPVVCLDHETEALSRCSPENPAPSATPEHLAYSIYTSGSTGRSKGVLVDQRALINHCLDFIRRFELRQEDRVLQFASLGFDVAAEEMIPTLLSGATLVLRSEELSAVVTDCSEFLARERITVVNFPSPYWHEWVIELAEGRSELPSSLRLMIVGSDTVLPQRLVEWQQQAGSGVRWCNAYGPTEATIGATLFEPEAGTWDGSTVPIGRPIANTSAL
ncbi:MAG: AMP-binding protein, partial [Acidobacteriota bacterium]